MKINNHFDQKDLLHLRQIFSVSNGIKMRNFHPFLKLVILIFFSIFTTFSMKGNTKKEAFNVSEFIIHHIQDAHEWHLWGKDSTATSIYLPVILWDNGLKLFNSKVIVCTPLPFL